MRVGALTPLLNQSNTDEPGTIRNERWNHLPSSVWIKALDHLLSLAEKTAAENDLPLIVERSSGSEARYLHVLRHGSWFGIRIASHFPVYACSKDYFQIYLEDPPTERAISFSVQQIEEQIMNGCQVVASPETVESEIGRQINASLTLRKVAALRHRLNLRAKWTHELQRSQGAR